MRLHTSSLIIAVISDLCSGGAINTEINYKGENDGGSNFRVKYDSGACTIKYKDLPHLDNETKYQEPAAKGILGGCIDFNPPEGVFRYSSDKPELSPTAGTDNDDRTPRPRVVCKGSLRSDNHQRNFVVKYVSSDIPTKSGWFGTTIDSDLQAEICVRMQKRIEKWLAHLKGQRLL